MQYSERFKEKMVQRMAGPNGMTATELSQQVGASQSTLSRWLRQTNVAGVMSVVRRDRLFFLAALAQALLTLLGAAGERCGLDRTLKTNTSKTRTISLFK